MNRITVEVPARSSVVDLLLGRLLRSRPDDTIALSGEPRAEGFRVDDRSHLSTEEDVTANDRAKTGSLEWRHLASLMPGMADTDPATALSRMQERFTSEPTEENADLLQAAINQITRSPTLREEHSDEVEAAKRIFHAGEGLQDDTLADNIWYEAYTDVNFGGPEFFTSMTPNWAYWRQPDFRNVRAVYSAASAQDVISSVQFGSSASETGGQVVFFEHTRYDGRYRNFSVPRGGQQDVPWIGADFNDLASSALIIRRFPNELPPTSVAQNLTLPPLSELTGSSQFADAISFDGPPIVTWDMWPIGPRSRDDWHPDDISKAMIEVIVPLRLRLSVKIGWSPTIDVDYRLQAKYWIFPFVRDGRFDATIEYYGWWVEGGLATSYIAPALRSLVAGSIPRVRDRVRSTVNRIRAVAPRLSFCYLLPGRNDERGHVADDVTLVCVRQ